MAEFYYPKTIKGITIAFMNLFNNTIVKKYDRDGVFLHDIMVPIQFGPIEKAHHDRLEGHSFDINNIEVGKRFYYTIPRMSVTIDSISYNSDRAYGVNEKRYWQGENINDDLNEILFSDHQPAPWDIGFTLHIKSDSLDYFSQILENILPYFNPAIFLRVREFSFLNIERDIKVNLSNVSTEFTEDMNNEDTKYCNCSISFTAETFQYRPWSHSKIIKVINTKYFVDEEVAPVTSYGTSAVPLDLSGSPDPLSAVPDYATLTTSGAFIDDRKKFNWYKGAVLEE